MPLPEARVIICHGDDEIAIAQYIRTLEAEIRSDPMGDVNLTCLDVKTAGDNEVATAIMSAPFFAARRLVVLENPLPVLRGRGGGDEDEAENSLREPEPAGSPEKKQKLITLLEGVPETTLLVLIIEDQQAWDKKSKSMEWTVLKPSHYLVKWANAQNGGALLQPYLLPKAQEMPGWLAKEAGKRGLKISPRAVAELVQYVGNDTRLALMELEKLDMYLGERRTIEPEDVTSICTFTSTATIWQLVDAIGAKQVNRALEIHRQLLETMDEHEIFPLIIRQFRLLIMTREVLDAHVTGNNEVAARIGVAPFQAGNLVTQASRFTRDGLSAIYHRLMEIDEADKSGVTDLPALVDALIIEAAGESR